MLLGATGTIGRATVNKLLESGYQVVCPIRSKAADPGSTAERHNSPSLSGADLLFGEVTDTEWLAEAVFQNGRYDAVISCLTSRTGEPRDTWAIDHDVHQQVLALARQHGVPKFVLLSAICVQKPRLAFQYAKLAFEKSLVESGLDYSIVRPTAYFKSLSGQVKRLQAGKPFLVFGDGELTACKPISDNDLATFLVDCLQDQTRRNRILPIGGPGPALTPRQQGELLFRLLGLPPRLKRVPPSLLSGIAVLLGGLGKLSPALAAKAEFARIGHYYATESMLVLNQDTGHYDADATPETGGDRLADHYRKLIKGQTTVDLAEHAVFHRSQKSA